MQQTTVCGLTRVSNCHFLSCPPLPLPPSHSRKYKIPPLHFVGRWISKWNTNHLSQRDCFWRTKGLLSDNNSNSNKQCIYIYIIWSTQAWKTNTLKVILSSADLYFSEPFSTQKISSKVRVILHIARKCNVRRQMKANQAAFTCFAQNQFSVWQQLTRSDGPEWSFPVKKQHSFLCIKLFCRPYRKGMFCLKSIILFHLLSSSLCIPSLEVIWPEI